MSGQLIITGDDFGRSAAINEAIASYHAAGALTYVDGLLAREGRRDIALNPPATLIHLAQSRAARSIV